jgi:glycosyltransferase involved in cell wall biosynthesis
VHRVSLLVPPTAAQLRVANVLIPFDATHPTFLFLGQLIARKNVSLLLSASSLLQTERGLPFSVWIVGDGPLLPNLVSLTQKLQLQDVVTFTPSVQYDAVGHVYERSDVLVMPSLYDYRSMVVLEAMRFRMPVIDSSGDGNAGDSVKHGINGFVVDPRDPEDLASAMKQFIERPGLIATMGRASADYIAEYTPDTAASSLRHALTITSETS